MKKNKVTEGKAFQMGSVNQDHHGFRIVLRHGIRCKECWNQFTKEKGAKNK